MPLVASTVPVLSNVVCSQLRPVPADFVSVPLLTNSPIAPPDCTTPPSDRKSHVPALSIRAPSFRNRW
jgi:hypothetical protein